MGLFLVKYSPVEKLGDPELLFLKILSFSGQNKYESIGSDFIFQVISPSCNDDITVKKDQCLVRSFIDSKL
jgi:hypothetical protein